MMGRRGAESSGAVISPNPSSRSQQITCSQCQGSVPGEDAFAGEEGRLGKKRGDFWRRRSWEMSLRVPCVVMTGSQPTSLVTVKQVSHPFISKKSGGWRASLHPLSDATDFASDGVITLLCLLMPPDKGWCTVIAQIPQLPEGKTLLASLHAYSNSRAQALRRATVGPRPFFLGLLTDKVPQGIGATDRLL